MLISKHLKTLQPVSINIQIIFRELVCSLLKSLILKFVKNVKSQCGDAAAVLYAEVCWTLSSIPLHTLETGWSVFKCFDINILD